MATYGIYVRGGEGSEVDVSDNYVDGFDRGIDAEGGTVRVERNTVIARVLHPSTRVDRAIALAGLVFVALTFAAAVVFGILQLH